MEQNAKGSTSKAPAQEGVKQSELKRPAVSRTFFSPAKGTDYLRAGVPLQELPPAVFLELASRIGNSAMLDILASNSKERTRAETVSGVPNFSGIRLEPNRIETSKPELAVPPTHVSEPVAGSQAFNLGQLTDRANPMGFSAWRFAFGADYASRLISPEPGSEPTPGTALGTEGSDG